MKRFNITEEEKKDILKIYQTKKILNEQPFKFPNLLKLFGSFADDIARSFSDDGAKNIDLVLGKILSSEKNFATNSSGAGYVKSLSGNWFPMSQIETAIKSAANGKMDKLDLLPKKLADGTEFRSVVITAIEQKEKQNVAQAVSSAGAANLAVPSWVESKWFYTKHTNDNIAQLFEKVKKLENIAFNPSKIKVTNKTMISGREVLELKLPTGDEILCYKSTGKGAPELKQAGDWQLINGFVPTWDKSDVKWFIKDEATTQLTKGLNQYATKLDQFLKRYGPDALGR
jgi:hypothetical protein